jgi:hypothetical protein
VAKLDLVYVHGNNSPNWPLLRFTAFGSATAVTALRGSLVGQQLSRQRAFVGAVRQKVRSASIKPAELL